MSDRRVFRWATTSARLLAGTLVAVAVRRRRRDGGLGAVADRGPRTGRGRRDARAGGERPRVHGRSAGARPRTRGRRPRRRRGAADRDQRGGRGRSRPVETPLDVADRPTAPHRRSRSSREPDRRHADGCRGIRLRHRRRRRPRAASRHPRADRRSWSPGSSAARRRPGPPTSCCSRTRARCPRRSSSPSSAPAARRSRPAAATSSSPRGLSSSSRSPGCVLGEESPVIRVTAAGAPVQAVAADEHHAHAPPGRRRPGRRGRRRRARAVDPGRHGHAEPGRRGRFGCRDRRAGALAGRRHDRDGHRFADRRIAAAVGPDHVPLAAGHPDRGRARRTAVGQYTVEVSAEQPGRSRPSGRPRDSTRDRTSPGTRRAARHRAEPVRGPARPGARAHARQSRRTIRSPCRSDSVDGSFRREVTVAAGAQRSRTADARGRSTCWMPAVAASARASRRPGDGALAGFPVWSADAAAQPIRVYP